jgi:dUTPase
MYLCNSSIMHAIFQITQDGHPPTHATSGSAGIDVPAQRTQIVKPGEVKIINLETTLTLPKNTCGVIAIRLWAAQLGLLNMGTIIDQDYTGPILATIANLGKKKIILTKGIAFCQIVIINCYSFGQSLSNDKTKQYSHNTKGDHWETTIDHLLVRQGHNSHQGPVMNKDERNIPTAPPAYEQCQNAIVFTDETRKEDNSSGFKIVVNQSSQTNTLWSRVRASISLTRLRRLANPSQ